ncbi:hypothetical protein BaRGS_00001625 [Batillaria attramentaria]|uniref:Uncharacterized protein n=1 Tax=Batillaria attramentaria TaxID=370345 RepID=A0ABD0M857_9CAEN
MRMKQMQNSQGDVPLLWRGFRMACACIGQMQNSKGCACVVEGFQDGMCMYWADAEQNRSDFALPGTYYEDIAIFSISINILYLPQVKRRFAFVVLRCRRTLSSGSFALFIQTRRRRLSAVRAIKLMRLMERQVSLGIIGLFLVKMPLMLLSCCFGLRKSRAGESYLSRAARFPQLLRSFGDSILRADRGCASILHPEP